jgi:predicted dehydrogenase
MVKKVRFGVVGTNKITDWLLAGAKEDERFELSAICSRTQERADEFAAKYGVKHTFTSVEEMASSDVVDAVYIATPNCTHAEIAITCMNRGKHVLCEKPMASNAHEVKQMIEAAKKNHVTLMEAMIATMNPNFIKVQELLPKLGTIRRYFASYCQYSSRYDKFKEGVVLNAFNPALSNGAMMDIGVYTIYPLIALFGKPKAVNAQGVMLSSGTDGQGVVNLLYDGMNATALYSKIANSYLPTEIEGEDGNLIMDEIHTIRKVTYIPRPAAMSGRGPKAEPQDMSVVSNHDDYYFEVAEFINLIEDGKLESEINSHAVSLATIEVIDEVRKQLGVAFPADKKL